jgi:hypothetical protein
VEALGGAARVRLISRGCGFLRFLSLTLVWRSASTPLWQYAATAPAHPNHYHKVGVEGLQMAWKDCKYIRNVRMPASQTQASKAMQRNAKPNTHLMPVCNVNRAPWPLHPTGDRGLHPLLHLTIARKLSRMHPCIIMSGRWTRSRRRTWYLARPAHICPTHACVAPLCCTVYRCFHYGLHAPCTAPTMPAGGRGHAGAPGAALRGPLRERQAGTGGDMAVAVVMHEGDHSTPPLAGSLMGSVVPSLTRGWDA